MGEEITSYLGVDIVCLWKGGTHRVVTKITTLPDIVAWMRNATHCYKYLNTWSPVGFVPGSYRTLRWGPFWRKYITRSWLWWFIASPCFLFSFCFLCADEMWSANFLLLMPCLPAPMPSPPWWTLLPSNHKSKYALSSWNCFCHDILSQQQKNN